MKTNTDTVNSVQLSKEDKEDRRARFHGGSRHSLAADLLDAEGNDKKEESKE